MLGTAVNRARKAAGLPREVKLEVEVEDVPEGVPRDCAHGALTNTREDRIEELAK